MWDWLQPAFPQSRGRVTFSGGGPTGAVAKATGTAGFRFQAYRALFSAIAGTGGA